jgi:hypothetical protein
VFAGAGDAFTDDLNDLLCVGKTNPAGGGQNFEGAGLGPAMRTVRPVTVNNRYLVLGQRLSPFG